MPDVKKTTDTSGAADEPDPFDFLSDSSDEETTLESPEKTKVEEQPKPHQHSPRVLALAQELGLSRKEASLFSPEELRAELQAAAQIAQLRPAPAPAPEPAEEEEEIDWGEIEDVDPDTGRRTKRKATEDDFSAPIARKIKEQQKAIKDLMKAHVERAAREEREAKERRRDMLDAAFQSLPDKYKKVFGTFTIEDYDPNDEEHVDQLRSRKAAIAAADGDLNVAGQAKINKEIRAAAQSLYDRYLTDGGSGDEPEKAVKKKTPLEERKEQWKNGTVARPTQRKANETATGKEAAKDFLRQKLSDIRERGKLDKDGAGGIPDDLPE